MRPSFINELIESAFGGPVPGMSLTKTASEADQIDELIYALEKVAEDLPLLVMDKVSAELSYEQRQELPDSAFCIVKTDPKTGKKIRKYPIHDIRHARNALARVSQSGTPEEREIVRRKVYTRYPELKKEFEERHGISPLSNKVLRAKETSDIRKAADDFLKLAQAAEQMAEQASVQAGEAAKQVVQQAIEQAAKEVAQAIVATAQVPAEEVEAKAELAAAQAAQVAKEVVQKAVPQVAQAKVEQASQAMQAQASQAQQAQPPQTQANQAQGQPTPQAEKQSADVVRKREALKALLKLAQQEAGGMQTSKQGVPAAKSIKEDPVLKNVPGKEFKEPVNPTQAAAEGVISAASVPGVVTPQLAEKATNKKEEAKVILGKPTSEQYPKSVDSAISEPYKIDEKGSPTDPTEPETKEAEDLLSLLLNF